MFSILKTKTFAMVYIKLKRLYQSNATSLKSCLRDLYMHFGTFWPTYVVKDEMLC